MSYAKLVLYSLLSLLIGSSIYMAYAYKTECWSIFEAPIMQKKKDATYISHERNKQCATYLTAEERNTIRQIVMRCKKLRLCSYSSRVNKGLKMRLLNSIGKREQFVYKAFSHVLDDFHGKTLGELFKQLNISGDI